MGPVSSDEVVGLIPASGETLHIGANHDKYTTKRKVMIAELETEATRNYHPDKKTKTVNAELGADKSLFDGVEVVQRGGPTQINKAMSLESSGVED